MALPEEIDELLATAARITEDNLCSVVYGCSRIPRNVRHPLLFMIRTLEIPTGQQLRVLDSQLAGPFRLLIVNKPWKPDGTPDSFHPIIIGREDGHFRIIGYVLPFNELFAFFDSEQMKHIRSLASWWIDWIEEVKKRNPA